MKREQVLYHHGILGMKWGIRRFQNKDGSLTDAGRKRYSSTEVENDVKALLSNKTEVNAITSEGQSISKLADELGKKYTDAFKTVKLDSRTKDQIWEQLRSDFVNRDNVDDEEYYNMIVEEYVDDALFRSLPESVISARRQYDNKQEQYWNRVKTFTKDLTDKYDEADIKDNVRDGKMLLNDMLYRDGLNTSYPSYLSRHFDDYWVYDTSEHYAAVNRLKKEFSLDKFK